MYMCHHNQRCTAAGGGLGVMRHAHASVDACLLMYIFICYEYLYIYTHIYIYIHTQRNVNSYVQMTLTHTHKPLEASLLDFYFFRRYAHVLCVLLVHCDSCNSKRRLPAFSDGNGSLQLVADVSKRQMHETMFIASQVSQPVRRITGLGCTDFSLLLAYVCEYNGLRRRCRAHNITSVGLH